MTNSNKGAEARQIQEAVDKIFDLFGLVPQMCAADGRDKAISTDDTDQLRGILRALAEPAAPSQPSLIDDVLWNGVFIERQKFIREWGRKQELGEIGDDLLDTLLSFWAEVHALAAPSQDAPLFRCNGSCGRDATHGEIKAGREVCECGGDFVEIVPQVEEPNV